MSSRGDLAIFDLDGTVTRRDTLLPYLWGWLSQRAARPASGLWLVPELFAFLAHRDRGRLKGRLIQRMMGGARHDEVRQWTREFVQGIGEAQLRPGALRAIAAHQAAGDDLILLSASVDLYVPDIGRRLGFAETYCTGVAWFGDVLVGGLTTPNHRGAHKARILQSLRSRHPVRRIHAYGNAASDLDHLVLADAPLLVNAPRAARRAAGRLGIPCADW